MVKNKKVNIAEKQSKKSNDLSEIWRDSPAVSEDSPTVSDASPQSLSDDEDSSVQCSNCKSSATIDPREVHECPKCDALFCCETCYLGGGENCCSLKKDKKDGPDENEELMYDNILLVLKAITVLVVVGTVSLKAIYAEEDEVDHDST